MNLARIDFDKMEKEVVARIRMLRLVVQNVDRNPVSDKVAQDVILPCIVKLMEFCDAVTIKEDEEDE
jgi:hypothetical protein